MPFFIVRNIPHERLGGESGTGWQAVGFSTALNSLGCVRGAPPATGCRARDHAEPCGNARTMPQREVAGRFDSMTYGVAEVEGLSQSTLPLICGHDISLDGDVACDNGGEAINVGSGERAPLELGK